MLKISKNNLEKRDKIIIINMCLSTQLTNFQIVRKHYCIVNVSNRISVYIFDIVVYNIF